MWPENWNSYGAHPPRGEAVDHTIHWLTQLQDTLSPEQWIEPSVIAGGDGDMCVEVWHGGRKLTLYLDGETVDYLQVWDNEANARITDGVIETVGDAVKVWAWLWEGDAHAAIQ